MRTFLTHVYIILIFTLLIASCGKNQDDSTTILKNATSSMHKTDELNSDQEKLKPIVRAFSNLMNGKPSKTKFVFIKKGDKKKCKDPKGSCAEILSFMDAGEKSKGTPVTRNINSSDWRKDGKFHTIMMGGNLYAAQLFPAKRQMSIVEWDNKFLLKHIKDFKFTKPGITNDNIQFLVPPKVWDWWTGTDGQCCNDCWATHRSWGLPCTADYACCFGTCGKDPGCNDVNNPGGPGTPGGNDGACEGERMVTDAKVDIGDAICDYSGTVEKVMTDTGECIEVATNGVFSNCISKSIGEGGTTEPEETEDAFGNW